MDRHHTRFAPLHPRASTCRSAASSGCLPSSASRRTQSAAGHPCRRHQRQGLDRRLHARDPGGGGQARARLHLAASGAFQRTHPARRPAGRRRRAGRRARRCERVNAGQSISVFEITTAAAFLLFSADAGRLSAARSRPRRPVRRDQCDRASGGDRHHAGLDGPSRVSRRDVAKIAYEKAGILKRGAPAVIAAQADEALDVIEREAIRVGARWRLAERDYLDPRRERAAGVRGL